MINKVFLALGSNMGNREDNLTKAVSAVSGTEETRLLKVSNIYETKPVGFTEQDDFLNMAALIETGLSPLKLLDKLQEVETAMGRVREVRWGPRTVDIDILLYDDIKMNAQRLTIPHPRMFERAFVMVPLRDLDPDLKIDDRSIDEIIDNCEDKSGVILFKKLRAD